MLSAGYFFFFKQKTAYEMGQGIRSAIGFLVAGDLGIALADVNVGIGDTRVAPQHLTAGSWGNATALPAVQSALHALRQRLDPKEEGPVHVAAAPRPTRHQGRDVPVP